MSPLSPHHITSPKPLFWGNIRDMFSIFREWWILRQLRISENNTKFTKMDKELFVSKRTKKFLWCIPRSEKWQARRIKRDYLIIEKSKNRSPKFIEEGEDLSGNSYKAWIRLTADGRLHTISYVLAEWQKTFWGLVFTIPVIIVASPLAIGIFNWFIHITALYSPFW